MRRSRTGYTLLELLVTVALAAALMGLGGGAYVSLGQKTAYNQALASIAGLVGKARNTSSHMPATIRILPEEGIVYALTEQTLQELRFETVRTSPDDESPYVPNGINNLECDWSGAEVQDGEGRVGGGLRLQGHTINCGSYPNYDVTDGLAAEIWFRIEPSTDGRGSTRVTLIKKGTGFAADFERGTSGKSAVTVKLGLRDEQGGHTELRRAITLPDVREGEWTGFRMVYDRKNLITYLDQGYGPIEVDRHPETRELRPDRDADLVLMGTGFNGWVDDVRIGGVLRADPIRMPADVQLLGNERSIRFASGRLDPAAHQGVEVIGVQFGDNSSYLEIGTNGQVQDLREEAGEPQSVVPDDLQKTE